jgi:hypothetical protein
LLLLFYLHFNVFINDLCNVRRYSRYILFADDIKILRAIISAEDCTLLQSDIELIQGWCYANFMNLINSKTRAITVTKGTNALYCVTKHLILV